MRGECTSEALQEGQGGGDMESWGGGGPDPGVSVWPKGNWKSQKLLN